MSESISFTVYGTPQPQGSMRAFVHKGGVSVTSDNKKLKPWRQQVSQVALVSLRTRRPMFDKHVPVTMTLRCYFRKPQSAPKKRAQMVVKPDLSKLLRAAEDALTGIVYFDDGQIVSHETSKHYDGVERTEITVTAL